MNNDATIVITKREYIKDIYGPVEENFFLPSKRMSWKNEVFPINPGMIQTFPWLSKIAQNYNEYEVINLSFHYESSISNIGTSTTGNAGTINMAINYNVNNAPFKSKKDMLTYVDSKSTKCGKNLNIKMKENENSGAKGKYVRTVPPAKFLDLLQYDVGRLELGIDNIPPGYELQSIGQLWCEYTVLLRKPYEKQTTVMERADIFVSSQKILKPNFIIGDLKYVLQGATNNIGTKLEYNQAGNELAVIFPKSISGYFTITIRIKVPPEVSFIDTPFVPQQGWLYIDTYGDIEGALDMFAAAQTPADGNVYKSASRNYTPGKGTGTFIYQMNNLIGMGYDGRNGGNVSNSNVIVIKTVTLRIKPELPYPQLHLLQTEISITEYNPFWSYDANDLDNLGNYRNQPILLYEGVPFLPDSQFNPNP